MLYCQCSRRQREGRPSWATASATDARERGFYGMLGGLDCGAQERTAAQPGVTRSMIFGSAGATWPEKQDLFSCLEPAPLRFSCTTSAEEVERGGGSTKGGTRTTRSVPLHCAPSPPPTQPLFARAGVSLCLNVQSESRSSRRRQSADGLIQRFSVDSVANPLHLLKQPPPNWKKKKKKYPPPPRPPWGQAVPACTSRLHTSYRSWLARLPSPTPRPLRARINRREKQIVPQMFGKGPLFAPGPNKIIFTSYPAVIRAGRIEFYVALIILILA